MRSNVPETARVLSLSSGLPASVGIARGLAHFAFRAAAAFEYAQDVAGLGNFPALERGDLRQDALCLGFLCRGLRNRSNRLRRAVARVALAESRVLVRIGAVVVDSAAPHSMPPVVIILVETLRTSEAWHPLLPQVSGATRRSPGFTKRTYSGLSLSHSVYIRSAFAERSASLGSRGCGWAFRFNCSYSGEADAAPEATRASAFPPWQSVQPRRNVPVVCMVGSSVCVWQEIQPALLRSASSCVWPIRFGAALSSAARSEGAGMCVANAARSRLKASVAREKTCSIRVKRLRFFIPGFI